MKIRIFNTLKDTSIYKKTSFKKIFIPSYFEIIAGFTLSITDMLFISAVDIFFVNILAIIVTFMIISYITAQISANISSSKIIIENHDQNLNKQSHNNCLILAFFIGGFYSILLFLILPIIINYNTIPDKWLHSSIIFSKIISINALFVAIRKSFNAILAIHKKSKINLITTLVLICLNIIFNFFSYYIFLENNITYYIYSIAISTILSQLIVTIILYNILKKQNLFKNFSQEDISKSNLFRIIKMAKTSFISSIESSFFILLTYIFLTVMSFINLDFLIARNTLAPWFLLIGSIGQAWTVYANREISYFLVKNTNILWETINKIMTHSVLLTLIGSLLLITSILIFRPFLPLSKVPLLELILTFIFLTVIDIFRSINVITLTFFRLINEVNVIVYIAFITQTITGIIMIIICVWLAPLQPTSFKLGLFIFFILSIEEVIRSISNMLLLKKNKLLK